MAYFPSVAFLTGSVGTGEWIVLFVVVLIVVGPKRLPEIARKIGRTMEMFRRAADEFKDQLMTMDQESPVAVPPPETTDDAAAAYAQTDSTGMPEAYGNLYPDSAVYPGNEGQAENRPSDAAPGSSVSETRSEDENAEKLSEGGA